LASTRFDEMFVRNARHKTSLKMDVSQLLKPEAYPHPVSGLRMLETHISWVLLTGEYAYKLKKPCQYSFVDYSTRELRHHFCLKEIEYNRRLAAELYLGVVPIYRSETGSLRIGGLDDASLDSPEPIDYAVMMKQFPQDSILSARVDHHELTPESVDQLGRDIAEFHDSIERVDPNLECVQLVHIRQCAIDNIAMLQSGLSRDSHLQPVLASLLLWTEEEFNQRKPVFARRLRDGFVRRCHGDMHLNNLIQLNGTVMAFDCVEFNEEFQWIDVLSDLAFPVMDFIAKGRSDLAWRLFNAYLETRQDWLGLEAFRFYAVYRALVRAKVTWLDASQHGATTGQASNSQALNLWAQYIETATRLAFPPQCRLAITHGFSGSGKSTRALAYIAKQGGLRIRSDIERKRIVRDGEREDLYTPISRERIYDEILDLARHLLTWHYTVVVDATFLNRPLRHRFHTLAENLRVPFDILSCEAPTEELERRIEHRLRDPSDATVDVLHQQLENSDPLSDAERAMVRFD
jgi:aminoglycoside phosphotransferase family enzyme/predicted kinase